MCILWLAPAESLLNRFMTIVDENGRSFIFYADPDQLEAHMKSLSTTDARLSTAVLPLRWVWGIVALAGDSQRRGETRLS
jgi:hypothetical protein